MTNEENNKLIAEYMGWTKGDSDDEYVSPDGAAWLAEYIPYTSWDWLMPVVIKLLSKHQTDFTMYNPGYLNISDDYEVLIATDCKTGSEGRGKTAIEATYKAVVHMIKSINEFKTKKT